MTLLGRVLLLLLVPLALLVVSGTDAELQTLLYTRHGTSGKGGRPGVVDRPPWGRADTFRLHFRLWASLRIWATQLGSIQMLPSEFLRTISSNNRTSLLPKSV